MSLHIHAAAVSHTLKAHNQDCYAFKVLRSKEPDVADTALLVVADGVGSLHKGEDASAMAVAMLNRWWQREAFYFSGMEALQASLASYLEHINQSMLAQAAAEGIQWGATLSALVMKDGGYLAANIGDSPILLLSKGFTGCKAVQLSVQHTTLVQGSTKKKAVLTQCLGATQVQPSFTSGKLKAGQSFVLCSDGITKTITAGEVAAQLAPQPPGQAKQSLQALVQTARSHGEHDDSTILLAQVAGGREG